MSLLDPVLLLFLPTSRKHASAGYSGKFRGILGLTRGATVHVDSVDMVNRIGMQVDASRLLGISRRHLHDKPSKTGRKVSHITVRDSNENNLQTKLREELTVLNNCEAAEW
jgi:phosphoribosylaminoimidazole carboxylase (NCAIR synthetase)